MKFSLSRQQTRALNASTFIRNKYMAMNTRMGWKQICCNVTVLGLSGVVSTNVAGRLFEHQVVLLLGIRRKDKTILEKIIQE